MASERCCSSTSRTTSLMARSPCLTGPRPPLYVHVVPWSKFPIVLSYPHYPPSTHPPSPYILPPCHCSPVPRNTVERVYVDLQNDFVDGSLAVPDGSPPPPTTRRPPISCPPSIVPSSPAPLTSS